MLNSLDFVKTACKQYAAYFNKQYIGDVLKCTSGWLFRAHDSNWISPSYAHTRAEAVVRWPGFKELMVM